MRHKNLNIPSLRPLRSIKTIDNAENKTKNGNKSIIMLIEKKILNETFIILYNII